MNKSKLYQEIINNVTLDNFDTLKDKFNLTHNEMLGLFNYGLSSDIITSKKELLLFLLLEKQFLLTLDSKRVGLISDTHIGSQLDNFEYIRMSYDFFRSQEISDVLHLGDLFDAYSSRIDLTQDELFCLCNNQLKKFHDNYPKDINTHIILGNHDEIISKTGIDLFKELSSSTIDILGYGTSYVKCQDYKLCLEHKVSCSRLVPFRYNYDLIIQGHSHFFKYKEKKYILKIASCSDLQPNGKTTGLYAPGFATLDVTNDMQINCYNIVNNEINCSLKLKIKG